MRSVLYLVLLAALVTLGVWSASPAIDSYFHAQDACVARHNVHNHHSSHWADVVCP